MPTAMDDYLFDLRGYLVLKNAVDAEHITALNTVLDAIPPLEYGQWWGNVQRKDDNGVAGCELQNIVEAGEPFERLIDHPTWIEYLRRYCGEQGSYVEGLFIDECFASLRRTGGYFGAHSGGWRGALRGSYHYSNSTFRCGQVNILLALTDIGPGDGGTLVIPGSHKSNFEHPQVCQHPPFTTYTDTMDTVEGIVEVNLKKGDALLFVDGVTHGASSRTNPGERRAVIYRYGVSWGATAHGYVYSPELLGRLTAERRKILQPITPRVSGR
jgi:ectoine hydroxylase-related dioxygenase (phytanoyl-CoA dioxygenase family)